jgi:DNA-binding MarR family transcriptional regulator
VPEPDLSDGDYRALANFRFHLRRFVAFSEGEAKGVGLEPRHHQLLLVLRALPAETPATIAALAERLVLRHHTVVELVDRLEEKGLLTRDRDAADRRQVRLGITPRGSDLLRKLTVAHRQELRRSGPALVEALQAALATPRKRSAS